MTVAIRATDLVKSYSQGVRALDGVTLEVNSGEVLVVMGPSGSGKSTLIRTFNGLESLDGGALDVLGVPLDATHGERQVREIRKRVGMVFQQFNLFPHLSILDNITLAPIKVQQRAKAAAEQRAMDLLDQMGIREQAYKYPSQLSGGQQQRVAIARALALDPEVMLFDEPTSALDPERVKEVLDAMRQLAKGGMTMVVVTHELGFAREVADRVMFMDRGQVVETSDPETFFSNAREERSRRFLNQMQH
ncbi:BgtA-like ABC-type uptake transporter for acidic and neutral polar amino acids (N-II)/ ATPase subunit [Synechococcus sp. RS9907]|uniref:amino acid ABC transporter ATP-binding protein n=1 Tax=Synechococcus sp. RS9907 TaxID=221350 RepID=UPI00165E504D|nr:amino acid ABC transporter ATP-binding protein [Synechococcus sp. RS9907]QNI82766.1 BgtA-like ABC-type uptake transporter for acidic and neutral polar amino acids (N-II)/ ATPase subunit [Synechococcus sp. RS9907]